jgi:hypothetical protein
VVSSTRKPAGGLWLPWRAEGRGRAVLGLGGSASLNAGRKAMATAFGASLASARVKDSAIKMKRGGGGGGRAEVCLATKPPGGAFLDRPLIFRSLGLNVDCGCCSDVAIARLVSRNQ